MKYLISSLIIFILIALIGAPKYLTSSNEKISQTYQQYAGYNGFIGIVNIVEIVNAGSEISNVSLDFINSEGVVSETLNFSLGTGQQRDIILNDLRSFKADTYGLVRITSLSPNIQGRVSYYRSSKDNKKEFDFAFSTQLQQGKSGDSFVTFNTFDPSNAGAVTANWLTVINLNALSDKTFHMQKYSQDGRPIGLEDTFVLKPFERKDIEGGHENPGSEQIGLIRISPVDPTSAYMSQLLRYGEQIGSSNFALAFPLEAKAGSNNSLLVPLNTSVYDGAYKGFNWLEVINVTNQKVQVLATVFGKNGTQLKTLDFDIEPYSQRHFPTFELLGQNELLGSIRLEPKSGKIIAQSVFYEQSSVGKAILGAYPMQGEIVTDLSNQVSLSWNRFLNMENFLTIINLADSIQTLNFTVQSYDGGKTEFTKEVGPYGVLSIPLNDSQSGTRENAYGTVVIKGSGKIFADLLRARSIRKDEIDKKQLDFFNYTLSHVSDNLNDDKLNPSPSPTPSRSPVISPTRTPTIAPSSAPRPSSTASRSPVISPTRSPTISPSGTPFPGSDAIHTISYKNNSGDISRGLVKFGVAFEKGEIASGRLPVIMRNGNRLRSSVIDVARWSDGSIRKATLAVDLGLVNAYENVILELVSQVGTQSESTFDCINYVSNLTNDHVVKLSNRRGFTSGNLSNLNFSLKNSFSHSSRTEIKENSPLLVRSESWEKVTGEEHLIVIHYTDFWLDENQQVLGMEWVPVLSQNWFVKNPFGITQNKESQTYDVEVKIGDKIVDSRSSLNHAYYTRWASLFSEDNEQHATPHWIGSIPKSNFTLNYSLVSKKKLARVGYFPPLNWQMQNYNLTATRTYVPLGTNGHRAGINGTGAYPGRGAITQMDANALSIQSAESWRRARVSAQAQLAVGWHTRDHRILDIKSGLRIIPQPFRQLGAKTYPGLGPEILHGLGDAGVAWTLKDDAATGGAGAFYAYDDAHHVNYSGLMAFVTGEAYLKDATYSGFEQVMTYSHLSSGAHNRMLLWGNLWGPSPRAQALGIPNTHYDVTPAMIQPRGIGWSLNAMLWAWGLSSDNDPHKTYFTNALNNTDKWFIDSYSYFPAAEKEFGGFSLTQAPNVSSRWMENFGTIVVAPWIKQVEDNGASTFGGLKSYSNAIAKSLKNIHAGNRLYVTTDYVTVVPFDKDGLNFIEGEKIPYAWGSATFANGVFTAVPKYGLRWANGDKVMMSSRTSGAALIIPPAPFQLTKVYYMVNVNGNNFQLSSTLNGQPIQSSQSGTTWIGTLPVSYAQKVAGVNGTYLPNADSYGTIAEAATVASYVHGNPEITRNIAEDYFNFVSKTNFSTYSAWNYSPDQY